MYLSTSSSEMIITNGNNTTQNSESGEVVGVGGLGVKEQY